MGKSSATDKNTLKGTDGFWTKPVVVVGGGLAQCTLPATAAATDANTVLTDGCYHAPVSGGGLAQCTLPATAAATDANTVLKDGFYHAPVSGGGLAQCTLPAPAAETTRNTVHGTDGCWTKP